MTQPKINQQKNDRKYPLTQWLNYLTLKAPRSFYWATKFKITKRPPS